LLPCLTSSSTRQWPVILVQQPGKGRRGIDALAAIGHGRKAQSAETFQLHQCNALTELAAVKAPVSEHVVNQKSSNHCQPKVAPSMPTLEQNLDAVKAIVKKDAVSMRKLSQRVVATSSSPLTRSNNVNSGAELGCNRDPCQ
jgi:hypothetical protein